MKTRSENELVEDANKVIFFEREDCKQKIEDFVEEFPLAKQFLKQIIDEINLDSKLSALEYCLYVAFIRILLKVNEDKSNVVEKAEIDKYILSNEDIKRQIINEYIKGIMNNAPPILVDTDGMAVSSNEKKPVNFFEAGEMAKLILR